MGPEAEILDELPRSRALRGLRELLRGDRYVQGEWLPTEAALCERLRVSRGTLRAAMKRLEGDGLLEAQAGRGRRVVRATATRSSMLAQGIAIVTHATQGHPLGGTDHAIQGSALAAIDEAGLHAVMLHPDRLMQSGIDALVAERPRGMLLMRRIVETKLGQETLSKFKAARIPTVLYGESPDWPEFDSVVSDHEAGSYAMTRWLIGQGRRRILRFWQLKAGTAPHAQVEWLKERDAGHERAMREAGLEPLAAKACFTISEEEATASDFNLRVDLATGQLVGHLSGADAVDAIMVISDGMLRPVAAACGRLGKVPNRDVLLVGYDNFWPHDPARQWESTIPAATVDKRNDAIGRALIELLLARIDGRLDTVPQHQRIAPELVVTDATPHHGAPSSVGRNVGEFETLER